MIRIVRPYREPPQFQGRLSRLAGEGLVESAIVAGKAEADDEHHDDPERDRGERLT